MLPAYPKFPPAKKKPAPKKKQIPAPVMPGKKKSK